MKNEPSQTALVTAFLAKIAGPEASTYTIARIACNLIRYERTLTAISTAQCNGLYQQITARQTSEEREAIEAKWEAKLERREEIAGHKARVSFDLLQCDTHAIRFQGDPRGSALRIYLISDPEREFAI